MGWMGWTYGPAPAAECRRGPLRDRHEWVDIKPGPGAMHTGATYQSCAACGQRRARGGWLAPNGMRVTVDPQWLDRGTFTIIKPPPPPSDVKRQWGPMPRPAHVQKDIALADQALAAAQLDRTKAQLLDSVERVEALTVQPGDAVCVTIPAETRISQAAFHHIREGLVDLFGPDVKVLVMEGGMTVTVVRDERGDPE